MGLLDGFSKWWVTSWPHRWRLKRHVPDFLRACPEPFRGEVLELGAGHGWTSRNILTTFPQVELTSVDNDTTATAAFQILEKKFGRRLRVKEENLFQLSFDRESFDIVIGINVFSQLKPYTLRKGIQEALRVLRPGGLLGISDWTLVHVNHTAHREAIEEILKQEMCDILFIRGDRSYDIWARKPYPISPDELSR